MTPASTGHGVDEAPRRAALVVIGGSAGAVSALCKLFPLLPAGFRLPVAVVVHLPSRGSNALAEVLAHASQLPVVEAVDKMPLEPGRIHLAPANYHLLIDNGPRAALSVDPAVCFCRPAIDPLFESAAALLAEQVVGIILTGANEDGAAGLHAVCARGGLGLVQRFDEAECDTMPRAAAREAPTARVLPLDTIGELLVQLDLAAR